ncbi:MAG: hypothetical protein ABSE15_02495 [Candidatus Bathyarchaeia archaeon]
MNAMTATQKLSQRISLVIHSLGLSCLGGAIFIQILVFSSILQQGYFRAVETNPTILASEITLTAFTLTYFIYIYQRLIRTSLKY